MDEKRKEKEIHELTADEIDVLSLRNSLQAESMTRKFPNTISPIPTRMSRPSLAPMMPPSMILLSMKRATS